MWTLSSIKWVSGGVCELVPIVVKHGGLLGGLICLLWFHVLSSRNSVSAEERFNKKIAFFVNR